jgi:hypothetical protein
LSGAVKIHVPEVRLAKVLRTPGGPPVAEALSNAQAGLDTLRQPCLDELAAALSRAQACAARFGAEFDPGLLRELYDIAAGPIGTPSLCGLDAIDKVLVSLCDLLEGLRTSRRWEREPVLVHLQAFQLLLVSQLQGAEAEAILDGLRRVTKRFAEGASSAG